MAKGKNEILLSIALEGDADVKAKLKSVGEEGKKSLADIEKNLGAAQKRFDNFGGKGLGGGLKEALAPLSEASGLGGLLGSLGAGGLFSRLGSALASPAGLVAGITTALLGMAKLGDETQRQKNRLQGLGDAGGFDKLTDQAKKLGTGVSDLQPRYEKFLQFQEKARAGNRSIITPPNFEPGQAEETASGVRVLGGGKEITPPSREKFQAFDSALFNQVRRDVKSADEAHAIVGQFEDGLAKSGLTGDSLRSLQASAPHAANFVKDSVAPRLGRGFANPNELATLLDRGGAKVGATDLVNEGAKLAPEANQQAEAARGVTQAFEALTAASGRLLEKFGGDPAGLGKGIDAAAKFVDKNGEKILQGPDRSDAPKSLKEVVTSDKGDLLGRAANFGLSGENAKTNGFGGGNPFGVITDFVKRAFTNPGSFQEKTRGEAEAPDGTSSIPLPRARPSDLGVVGQKASDAASATQPQEYIPPPANEFPYIPPPTPEEQQRLERDRAQPPLTPSSYPAQQPSNTPVRFGEGAREKASFTTASPLINITEKDIDNAIGVGLSAGPGTIASTRSVSAAAKLANAAKPGSEGSVVGYHGTSGDNLADILKNGIKVGEDKSSWVSARDSFAALTAETKSGGVGKGNPVVLEVTIPADKFQESFRKLNQGGEWSTASTDKKIPPDWISGYHNVDKETGKLGPLQTLGPRSDAGEIAAPQQFAGLQQPAQQLSNTPAQFGQADQGQQFAGLSDKISQAFQSFLGSVTKPPDLKQEGPVSGAGIRGSNDDGSQNVAGSVKGAGDELADVIRQIAANLLNSAGGTSSLPVKVAAKDGGLIYRPDGGHISGPGTSTSDSIPAMLSDGEYVIKADSARKIGRSRLDGLNAMADGGPVDYSKFRPFADGGDVSGQSTSLTTGNHQISASEDGGADIDGVHYPPGSPILQDPIVKQALQRSRADTSSGSSGKKHKSDFTGLFGGHEFDTEGSYAKGGPVGRFASGGPVIDWPGFADGGFLGDVAIDAPPMQAEGGGGSEALHPVTIDLGGGRSVDGLRSPPDVIDALRKEAVIQSSMRTGKSPGWRE